MNRNEAYEKFNKVFQASEARQLQVLPGCISASGKLTAVLVVSEYRDEGMGLRRFVTPVGALLGPNLVTADGLSLTQECDDLFDELLMHLRSAAGAAEFYATKSGRAMVAFKPHGRSGKSRPVLMLPWWHTQEVFKATKAVADR